MRSFDQIYRIAAERKGGPAALEDLLPTPKPPAALRKIPDDRWLAGMTKRVFCAGFNWTVIENKWDGFEAAFEGFPPGRWAMMSDDDLDRLVQDKRIVRNAGKIQSVRDNAVFLCDLAREYGSAAKCFADWPDTDYVGLLDMLKRRASRLGGNSGQYFLRFMGKDSFITSGDVAKALVREGVVDKAPTSKRDLQAVQAAFNQWREESGRPLAQISRVLACSVDSD
jgi:3-methyladenine DNA glycosylase Tag